MANSIYDFYKEEEESVDLKFRRNMYIIVRIDGHKFHKFSAEHEFHKPNDKRALDLMVDSAKQVLRTYKGDIPLAYGHSDEFSFLVRSTSSLFSRRVHKINSMILVVFATHYNTNWDRFFPNPKKYDAWFDARPIDYPYCKDVIGYFRWRQIDCHINNLYNTTLHAITGRYVKYELQPDNQVKTTPITEWIEDKTMFLQPRAATEKLSKTVSSDKHDIMFLDYKINYNNELEQFKKGTIVVDDGSSGGFDEIKHFKFLAKFD